MRRSGSVPPRGRPRMRRRVNCFFGSGRFLVFLYCKFFMGFVGFGLIVLI
jgi:hypothetical protein